MGKPRPARAGGSTTPAELLAEAEAALADMTPEERAAAEDQLDELRQAARAEAEAERHEALAAQEIANAAAIHGPSQDVDQAAPVAQAERSEGGE
jgi:hypothetical protein